MATYAPGLLSRRCFTAGSCCHSACIHLVSTMADLAMLCAAKGVDISFKGINYNPCAVVINPTAVSVGATGINLSPQGISVAPTGVNVNPFGASISPSLIVIAPYDTTVAGQVCSQLQLVCMRICYSLCTRNIAGTSSFCMRYSLPRISAVQHAQIYKGTTTHFWRQNLPSFAQSAWATARNAAAKLRIYIASRPPSQLDGGTD